VKVISNTSPVLNLTLVHQERLLKDLYHSIIITTAVYDELQIYDLKLAKRILQSNWVEISEVQNRQQIDGLLDDLDIGEAEAIVLSAQIHTDLLLIDEKKGRTIAAQYDIPVAGTLSILIKSKENGLIHSVKPVLNRLISDAGFWIKEDLYFHVLERSGEL